jgi:hypothetical protein
MILLLLVALMFASLLIALAFGAWLWYQRESSAEPLAPPSPVQNISSPDGKLQAVIRGRPEDTFQVEVRRLRVDETENGPRESWELIHGPVIIGTLEEAVEIANQQMGNGQETQP